MKKLLLLCLLVLAPVSLASADLKVAVVDLGKAFDSYYKTKDAQSRINDKKARYQKDLQDMQADYERMGQEGQKLMDGAKDATLSAEARAEKNKALEQKKQDLMNLGRKIQETEKERTNELQDEIVRRHKEIIDEITRVINDYVGPQGYDLVIDKSSSSVSSGVPFVLFTSSKLIDITQDIVTKLNSGAPNPATAPSGAAPSAPPAPAAK